LLIGYNRVTKEERLCSRKRLKPRRFLTALLVTILVISALVIRIMCFPESPKGRVDIAIYAGRGTWNDSIQALEKMFGWMNYTVELIEADRINNNGLDGFGIVCIPGGNMYDYAQDLSDRGRENVRNFVQNGGGYIGICGGAYFAAERMSWRGNQMPVSSLCLFPGSAIGPIDEIMPYPNYTMCKVNIVNHTHSITDSEGDSEWMLYYWGPALIPNINARITILGAYDKGNQTAMLAFGYGKGRVFLVGTHPEIEEGGDRDGVSFGDEFDDEGSEWPLMGKTVLWLTDR
jgi:biotin--protein ligase